VLLPDGCSDVPAGKVVSIVTHLEMVERPLLHPKHTRLILPDGQIT
jgi:hypothetical protein